MAQAKRDGFSIVGLLVALFVVLAIGFMGWYIYWSNHKTDETTNTTSTPQTTNETTTPTVAFVNVIQDGGSILVVTPDKIAKTADEAAILTDLHNICAGNDYYVTVNHIVFDGNSNFHQDGSYAYLNAGICTSTGASVDDIGPSGASRYLHKDSAGTWKLDASTQSEVDCAAVDGLGYPSSIVNTCFDGTMSRAPK